MIRASRFVAKKTRRVCFVAVSVVTVPTNPGIGPREGGDLYRSCASGGGADQFAAEHGRERAFVDHE